MSAIAPRSYEHNPGGEELATLTYSATWIPLILSQYQNCVDENLYKGGGRIEVETVVRSYHGYVDIGKRGIILPHAEAPIDSLAEPYSPLL